MKRHAVVGVMVEKTRRYGRTLCEGVAAAAREDGAISLKLLPCAGVASAKVLEGIDAVIVSAAAERAVSRFRKRGIRIVAVYDKARGTDVVDADHCRIADLAVRHFLDRGFRSFAFCGFDGSVFSDMRRDAFSAILERSGFKCMSYRMPRGAYRDFDDFVIANERADSIPDYSSLSRWIAGLPARTAVFCANDLRAYNVVRVCELIGRKVPGEIAVLGVDDDELLCSFSNPTLSSIDPDPREVGRGAVRMIRRCLDGESSPGATVRVKPLGISVRESSDVFPVDPPWLAEALAFIRRNATGRISASDVFAHVGLSHTAVDRAFRKVRGCTVQQEIAESRFAEARRLLETTSASIAQVARSSGFSRVQYFCNLFTRRYGCSPAGWRVSRSSCQLHKS